MEEQQGRVEGLVLKRLVSKFVIISVFLRKVTSFLHIVDPAGWLYCDIAGGLALKDRQVCDQRF